MTATVSKRPPSKSESGEHPAVKGYREKLESIAESTSPQVDELNRKLDEYLQDVRTPIPPAP